MCMLKEINGNAPKNYFSQLFWKIFFYFKKLLHKKYWKPHLSQKSSYWFLSPEPASHSGHVLSANGFSQLFQHKLKNIRKVFLFESILIRKKMLWRINFVLIKFSPNAILFEKLQNECKNPAFLHKVTCIRPEPSRRSCQVSHSWLYTLGCFDNAYVNCNMIGLVLHILQHFA